MISESKDKFFINEFSAVMYREDHGKNQTEDESDVQPTNVVLKVDKNRDGKTSMSYIYFDYSQSRIMTDAEFIEVFQETLTIWAVDKDLGNGTATPQIISTEILDFCFRTPRFLFLYFEKWFCIIAGIFFTARHWYEPASLIGVSAGWLIDENTTLKGKSGGKF